MENSLDDPRRFSKLQKQFHNQLAKTTGNQLLVWIIQQMNSTRDNSEWLTMRSHLLYRGIIRKYNTGHWALIDAIRKWDADLAARLMRDHFQHARLAMNTATDT